MRQGRGTVLIVTMWVVLVLAGLVLVFARTVRVEAIASANHLAALQADAIARGALQFVLSKVDGVQDPSSLDEDVVCEQVEVGDGYFWILRPSLEDDRSYYFGISDEGSRINLNSATLDMLLKMPGMTAELAAAIGGTPTARYRRVALRANTTCSFRTPTTARMRLSRRWKKCC